MGSTIGAVNMERGARSALTQDRAEEVKDALRRYPRVFMAGAFLGGPPGEEGFLWCLDSMLDTLARDLA